MFRNVPIQLLMPMSKCPVLCFLYHWSQAITKAEPDWFSVVLCSPLKYKQTYWSAALSALRTSFFSIFFSCHSSRKIGVQPIAITSAKVVCSPLPSVIVKCWNPRFHAQAYKQLISFLGSSVFSCNNTEWNYPEEFCSLLCASLKFYFLWIFSKTIFF